MRDTKLERTQHDASGKHQSAIQKTLRTIHRTNETEKREQEKAKAEVARLNRLTGTGTPSTVGGSSSSSSKWGNVSVAKREPTYTKEPVRQATMEERRRQMAQLAAMGVAIPNEFRQDMAMPGDWQVVETKPVEGEYRDQKIAVGVRKRKLEGGTDGTGYSDDEGREYGGERRRPKWGTGTKSYPRQREVEGVDDLLSRSIRLKDVAVEDEVGVKKEEGTNVKKEEELDVKKEEDLDEKCATHVISASMGDQDINPEIKADEDVPSVPRPVFKKRKMKGIKT